MTVTQEPHAKAGRANSANLHLPPLPPRIPLCPSDSCLPDQLDCNMSELLAQKTSSELEAHTILKNKARYKNFSPIRDINSAIHITSIIVTGFDTKTIAGKEVTVYNIQVTRTDPLDPSKVSTRYIFRTFDQLLELARILDASSRAAGYFLPSFPARKEKAITAFVQKAESPAIVKTTDVLSLGIASTGNPKGSKSFSTPRDATKKLRIQRMNHYFEQILGVDSSHEQANSAGPLKKWASEQTGFDDFFRQSLEDIDDEIFYLQLADKSGIDLLAK